ncbi:MAG: M14 family zinc carboxypeptidase [Pseudobdellovibrionaceae bacterium]
MYPIRVGQKLPELLDLESIIDELRDRAEVSVVAHAEHRNYRLPIYKVVMGSKDPQAPVLGLFGGVHGLERIGSQVILSILRSVVELLSWDSVINRTLKESRLVFMPIINPVGMMLKQRSNGNGVDIMRNAPVEADGTSYPLIGGHRISSRLPWYRGSAVNSMEVETRAIIDVVEKEMSKSKVAISVDFHSGFGVQDQLWFPYAKTTAPFPQLAEMYGLKALLDRTYPNHFYVVEPQSQNYTTHGDVWDYVYDNMRTRNLISHVGSQETSSRNQVYMPLTLEMGSWLWVKKNPRQALTALGPFNPVMPHRRQRILRRHNTLFEFLLRSIISHDPWAHLKEESRRKFERKALELWYNNDKP